MRSTPFFKYRIFPLFKLILISFFCQNYVKPFLSTVNKCTITMIIIIINVKSFLERHFCSSFLERHFCGITITFLKINVLLWQKAVLHVTTLILCKARQVLRDLFNTNQGNDSDITFVAGATKINLQNLKT